MTTQGQPASLTSTESSAVTTGDQRFAHLYKSSGPAAYDLTISRGYRAADGTIAVIAVGGKRDARKIAAEYNAKPWNF